METINDFWGKKAVAKAQKYLAQKKEASAVQSKVSAEASEQSKEPSPVPTTSASTESNSTPSKHVPTTSTSNCSKVAIESNPTPKPLRTLLMPGKSAVPLNQTPKALRTIVPKKKAAPLLSNSAPMTKRVATKLNPSRFEMNLPAADSVTKPPAPTKQSKLGKLSNLKRKRVGAALPKKKQGKKTSFS